MEILKNKKKFNECYPIFISPNGKRYTLIYYACGYPNNYYEWFGFINIGNNKYFGFIYNEEGGIGYFDANDLKKQHILSTIDSDDLITLKPPPDWMKESVYV